MFADLAVPLLFKEVYAKGGKKERLIVFVAGGAQVMDDRGFFNIGKRNYAVLRKMLWKNGIMIKAEHVGGKRSRTMTMSMETGKVHLLIPGVGKVDL